MAQKKGRRRKNANKYNEIAGVVLIAVGALFALSAYFNVISALGDVMNIIAFGMCGAAGYALPAIFIIAGVLLIAAKTKKHNGSKILLVVLIFLFAMCLVHLTAVKSVDTGSGFGTYVKSSFTIGDTDRLGGGVIGSVLVYPTYTYLGIAGSVIVFVAAVVVCVVALTNLSIKKVSQDIGQAVKTAHEGYKVRAEEHRRVRAEKKRLYIEDLGNPESDPMTYEDNPFDIRIKPGVNQIEVEREYRVEEAAPFDEDYGAELDETFYRTALGEDAAPAAKTAVTQEKSKDHYKDLFRDIDVSFDEQEEPPEQKKKRKVAEDTEEKPPVAPVRRKTAVKAADKTEKPIEAADTDDADEIIPETGHKEYFKPPVTLLNSVKKAAAKTGAVDIRQNAKMLEDTLANFGISAKVLSVARGPVVTRYEISPAPGVKVSRIVNLADDIALCFAVGGVRIEAPIPGKAAVGVEVPNAERIGVPIREMLDCEEFEQLKSPTAFALGKDIAGKNVYADMAKMPHLLIAGQTGAGKSVCVNALIASILFHASPDEVKFIMIDPKVVELEEYNNIPHLMIPVVTDTKKASSALGWAVNEMTLRYRLFAKKSAKDLERYNIVMEREGSDTLPKIIIIVDELADLMQTSAKEVEDSICRIAQLGRASGIHLVIATQRPSVDVITGLIKANVPSRIALAVSSHIDSKTILDKAGAEKLLGRGDMLFSPTGSPKPLRVQGCYIDDDEIAAVTNFLKENSETDDGYDEAVIEDIARENNSVKDEEEDEKDPLYQQAVGLVVDYDQASISMLQRRFRIGYARAARLIDEMEINNIITGYEGSKARQVLISKEQYCEMFNIKPEGDEDEL